MHRPGAFAEWVTVPAAVLIPWPPDLPAAAACLAEPLANGVHMVGLTRHLPVSPVLIIGAGPIGLMALHAFRLLRGAEVWCTDLSPERLAVAERLGATRTFHRDAGDPLTLLRAATGGEGVPLVIDAAGAGATKSLSLAALRPGGAAIWIGLHENRMTLDSYEITLPEKQIFGTYSATQEELAEAVRLLDRERPDVESWVTTAPLTEGAPLFQAMLHPGPCDLKGVLITQ